MPRRSLVGVLEMPLRPEGVHHRPSKNPPDCDWRVNVSVCMCMYRMNLYVYVYVCVCIVSFNLYLSVCIKDWQDSLRARSWPTCRCSRACSQSQAHQRLSQTPQESIACRHASGAGSKIQGWKKNVDDPRSAGNINKYYKSALDSCKDITYGQFHHRI
jgi:hypothetical protein